MNIGLILSIGIAVLIVVAVGFLALWVADARRADRVARDPQRVTGRWPWTRRAGRGQTPGTDR